MTSLSKSYISFQTEEKIQENLNKFIKLFAKVSYPIAVKITCEILGDDSMAEEITFLIAWRLIQKLPVIKNFRNWIITSVKNRCLDIKKANKSDQKESLDTAFSQPSKETSPAQILEGKELENLLEEWMRTNLKEEDQHILQLHILGYSGPEIGQQLNKTDAHIRKRIFTIRKRLKMEPWIPEYYRL